MERVHCLSTVLSFTVLTPFLFVEFIFSQKYHSPRSSSELPMSKIITYHRRSRRSSELELATMRHMRHYMMFRGQEIGGFSTVHVKNEVRISYLLLISQP